MVGEGDFGGLGNDFEDLGREVFGFWDGCSVLVVNVRVVEGLFGKVGGRSGFGGKSGEMTSVVRAHCGMLDKIENVCYNGGVRG